MFSGSRYHLKDGCEDVYFHSNVANAMSDVWVSSRTGLDLDHDSWGHQS